MQEEQRSLSSMETLSVWKLLLDDTVRWQVLSVVVINIGMQLSGIDAVSVVYKLSDTYKNEVPWYTTYDVHLNFQKFTTV